MEKKKNKDNMISRSNNLIEAKYTSTLLENKLMILALKEVKPDQYGRPTVSFSTEQLRYYTGVKGNGLYTTLRKASIGLSNKIILIEDKKKGYFELINIINKCTYKKGLFTVVFTPEANDLLNDLKSNYTTMSIDTLFSFTSNHSYRLYELLQVHVYKINDSNDPVPIEIGLSDLKLKMNCINTNTPAIQNELCKPSPDFDKIVDELSAEKKCRDWGNFKRYVLDRGIKEINEKTDLYVTYEPIRQGLGGKVTKVRFLLKKCENIDADDIIVPGLSSQQKSELAEELRLIMESASISKKDAYTLLKVADNDMEKIKDAWEHARQQPHIKNLIGWMKKYIKEGGYEAPVEVLKGDSNAAKTINQLKENMEENRESLAEGFWMRVKTKENFHEFKRYIEETLGFPFLFFDQAFDYEYKNKTYAAWASHK